MTSNTELQAFQQRLEESEERYRSLFAQSRDGITLMDLNYVILEANQYQAAMLGYEVDEMIGRSVFDFFLPEERGHALGRAEKVGQGQVLPITERRVVRKDGSIFIGEANLSLVRDSKGQPRYALGILRDITDRKEIEEQLRQSEQKYRNLVEQISDVIYSMDAHGIITYISPAVEAFLGYEPTDVIGKSFAQFIAPDDLPRANEAFNRLSTEELPGSREYRVLTKSGEVRWMQTSSKPAVENGRIIGLQGVLTDITTRKIAERQIKQAATVAERERLARELHDSVTQTLYSVAAISEALPRIWERNPEQARKGLSELTTLTNAALAEMRTLLLELRPETLEKQDLADLLQQLADGMMGRTRLPIHLRVDSNCVLPTDVRMAFYRITQEALNNIVKHSRATRAEVSLACEAGGTTLLIRDDGVGFNPQSVSSHRLGLDIMRERAQDIAADFNIQSDSSWGTCVSVTWREPTQG